MHDTIKNIWDLFATLPYYTMRPRQDLTSRGYCLADDDAHRLVIYFDAPEPIQIFAANTYSGEWLDPHQPTVRRAANLIASKCLLHPPDSRDDWFLYFTRVGHSNPGPDSITIDGQTRRKWPFYPSGMAKRTVHHPNRHNRR